MVDMKNDLRIKLIQEALDKAIDEFEQHKKAKYATTLEDSSGAFKCMDKMAYEFGTLLDFYNEVKRIITAGDELEEEKEETWSGLRLIDTHEDAFGNEYEVFKCGCGRTHTVQSGGDIACCPCEFEHEGEPANTFENTEGF